MGNRIVWLDIPVNDLERASNFYRQGLGVSIEIYAGDDAGCLFMNEGDEPSLLPKI